VARSQNAGTGITGCSTTYREAFPKSRNGLGNEATNDEEQATYDKIYYIHRNMNIRKRYIITKEKKAAFRQ